MNRRVFIGCLGCGCASAVLGCATLRDGKKGDAMEEHESNGEGLGQPQLFHDRHEIPAVRTEPMQQHDARGRRHRGLERDLELCFVWRVLHSRESRANARQGRGGVWLGRRRGMALGLSL